MTASRLDLFIIGFGRPDLLIQQLRLLKKNLLDEHGICVLDNTPDDLTAGEMETVCSDRKIGYLRVESKKHEHVDGLKTAAFVAADIEADYWGVIDHDVFATAPTRLIELIDVAGFLGLGQTYSPRVGEPLRYLWPGWCFFSRKWLAGRVPDFDGIRAEHKFDDGDCGSMMHSLFTDEDWDRLPNVGHGYGELRDRDGHGLQSYGYERIGSMIHFTNASRWKQIPDPSERDRLIREMLDAL